MAYHLEDGKIYVDTKFLNSVRVPGVSLEHMGFGEFYFQTPHGRVEVDRMRGKPFEGMSGRSHALYDDAGGQKAAEWLISEAEKKNQTEKVGSLRSKLIRLAHQNPSLRPHLLPMLREAADVPKSVAQINDALKKLNVGQGQAQLLEWGMAEEAADGKSWVWPWPNGDWAEIRQEKGHWVASPGRGTKPRTAALKVALSQVSKIILEQMGGARRLAMMLGIGSGPGYFFYDLPGNKGVGFSWPNRQRSKGNNVEIMLMPDDTYTVTFFNVSGEDKKQVKKHTGIYADQLVETFEGQTGWYLRL